MLADADKDVTFDIPDFKKDTADYLDTWKDSGVLGRLEYWKNMRRTCASARTPPGTWGRTTPVS